MVNIHYKYFIIKNTKLQHSFQLFDNFRFHAFISVVTE